MQYGKSHDLMITSYLAGGITGAVASFMIMANDVFLDAGMTLCKETFDQYCV